MLVRVRRRSHPPPARPISVVPRGAARRATPRLPQRRDRHADRRHAELLTHRAELLTAASGCCPAPAQNRRLSVGAAERALRARATLPLQPGSEARCARNAGRAAHREDRGHVLELVRVRAVGRERGSRAVLPCSPMCIALRMVVGLVLSTQARQAGSKEAGRQSVHFVRACSYILQFLFNGQRASTPLLVIVCRTASFWWMRCRSMRQAGEPRHPLRKAMPASLVPALQPLPGMLAVSSVSPPVYGHHRAGLRPCPNMVDLQGGRDRVRQWLRDMLCGNNAAQLACVCSTRRN
eukprot:365540-Chlamydomonas_euryale.AAC.16